MGMPWTARDGDDGGRALLIPETDALASSGKRFSHTPRDSTDARSGKPASRGKAGRGVLALASTLANP